MKLQFGLAKSFHLFGLTVSVLLLFTSTPCLAQTFPASFEFLRPEEGEIIDTTPDFNMKSFRMVVEQSGDLTERESIYYSCDDAGSPDAQKVDFESEDKSGVIEVFLYDVAPFSDHNGPFECCAYLAKADISPVSQTKCVSFEIHTAGVFVPSPRNGDEFISNTVSVSFKRRGIEAFTVGVSVDGAEPIINTDIFGVVTLPPLLNGPHTLEVQAIDRNDEKIGIPRVIQIEVNSALTPENVLAAESLIKKALRAGNPKRRGKVLKTLRDLLDEMSQGGANHPEVSSLTREKIEAALSYAGSAFKKRKNRKRASKLLKKMRKELERTRQ